MSRSLSTNRAVLASELQKLVFRYRTAPSTLLAELEEFLNDRDLGVPRPRYIPPKQKQPDLLREIAEDDPHFPGWNAL